MQVGLGFWASKTLLSAIEMEVFTELARHPEDLDALSERLGLHERSARDFFDALVALGFLERRDGVYTNTPASDLFLEGPACPPDAEVFYRIVAGDLPPETPPRRQTRATPGSAVRSSVGS